MIAQSNNSLFRISPQCKTESPVNSTPWGDAKQEQRNQMRLHDTTSTANQEEVATAPVVARYLSIAFTFIALTTTATAPALATTRHHHRTVHATRQSHAIVDTVDPEQDFSGPQVGAERAAALRACSVGSEKYSNSTWQTTQFAAYGTCMTEHGQLP
jgi:hypothetical protein